MVTVNLTAFLVLTTLFISVSGKLPPTAYVKMVDIWLIFTQMVPFIEVLLHTFMDCMREEEDRVINHHGHLDMTQHNGKEHVKEKKIFDENPRDKNGEDNREGYEEENGKEKREENGEKNKEENRKDEWEQNKDEKEQTKRIFVVPVNSSHSEVDKQVANTLGLLF